MLPGLGIAPRAVILSEAKDLRGVGEILRCAEHDSLRGRCFAAGRVTLIGHKRIAGV
jgi:hypothetical protein